MRVSKLMMPACSEMWINTWKYSACNRYVSSNIPQQPFQCPVFTATATVLSCIMQACWMLVAAMLHFICNVDHSSSSSFGSASNFSWHSLKNDYRTCQAIAEQCYCCISPCERNRLLLHFHSQGVRQNLSDLGKYYGDSCSKYQNSYYFLVLR